MDGDLYTLSDRLQYLIKNKSVTSYQISKETGLGQPILSNILRGKTKNPSNGTLDILSKYFNVNKDWLRDGVGDMNNESPDIKNSDQDTIAIDKKVLQTLISQQETIHSQLRIIEKLMEKDNQKDVRMGGPAECAGASGE